jgi:hypothetical protein
MKVYRILALALVVLGLVLTAVGLTGCSDAHLGDYYGRRTRTAFEAQAQAQAKPGDSAGSLDADDAKITLARQRGRALPGTPGAAMGGYPGTTYGASPYPSAAGMAGSSGMTSAGIPASPPTGPIRLDAVR